MMKKYDESMKYCCRLQSGGETYLIASFNTKKEAHSWAKTNKKNNAITSASLRLVEKNEIIAKQEEKNV